MAPPHGTQKDDSVPTVAVRDGQLAAVGGGTTTEDDDVAAERIRALSPDAATFAVRTVDLNKWYGKLHAVKNLTFVAENGDCFGLLGVNGAGKTTTFEMLTGQLAIDGGDAFLYGTSVRSDWRSACFSLGYCPQFDAFLKDLSARETLKIISYLRGIKDVDGKVKQLISDVNIEAHADKPVGNLSGGNKRRLSVALALIGDPRVVMLDEPTAGVDPRARRLIWDMLSRKRNEGTTFILTSHSMEECEALCTRVGIMIAGRLLCLGTNQHIKSKFGGSSTLTVKLGSVDEVDVAVERVQTELPNAVLKERHLTQVIFDVRRGRDDKWSLLFAKVDALAVELHFVDYSLSQATLEQAFIELTRSTLLGPAMPLRSGQPGGQPV